MKTIISVLLVWFAAAISAGAQSPEADTTDATVPVSAAAAIAAIPPTEDGYAVTEVGANHRRWSRVTAVPDARGGLSYVTNSYVELQDLLYYVRQGPTGPEWAESKAEIEGFPGGAIGRQADLKMIFANDLATVGAIDAETPAGRFRSHILGLAYADSALQTNCWLATVASCQGQIIAPNQILYPNALVGDGWSASVRYTYRVSGWEQDVLIKDPASLIAPESYGLDSRSPTLTLQVISEFLDPTAPALTSRTLMTAEGAAFEDQEVDWGLMKLQSGKAFFLGQDPDANGIPVFRRWVEVDSRHLLVEEMPFSSLMKALLTKDPGASLAPRAKSNRRLASLKSLPVLPTAKGDPKPMEVAAAPSLEGSLVADYIANITTTQSNLVFASDTTYYIPGTSGAVNLNGITTLEGGCVIKFASTNTAKLLVNGPLVCQTGPYRMAVLTSKNDSSIGEGISGASGNPTNTGAIYIDAAAGQTNAYSCLRVAYAGTGLRGPKFTNGVWHCQFVQCGTAVQSTASDPVRLRNVLLARCTNGVVTTGSFTGEHLTVDQCSTLLSGAGSSGNLTNCLLTAVTTLGNLNLYASLNLASSSGIYQTVGAGNYYLADGSTNRNAGLTNIHPTLLKDLRSRTTCPPLVFSNVVISANTTLSPQAQRETGVPDRGYAYDPLDWAFSAVRVTNAVLRLTTGTALASFGSSYGLGLLSGSQLISIGAPTNFNRVVRFNLVQECSNTNWNGGSTSVKGDWLGGSAPAQATFRFTAWSMPAQDGYHFSTSGYTMTNAFSDCQFHGGKLACWFRAFTFTNSLLERANTSISDDGPMSPTIRNCLFYGGQLSVGREFGGTWTFRDNLFDQTSISLPGQSVDAAYNGFTTNTVNVLGGSSNKTNLVADYQTGPLARYYYPTNGGSYSLTNLINSGSTWATNVGLYHYTTTTNQAKEAGTKVDIGYHLVALGTNGLPASASGDMLGDYFKDTNGNGVYDIADMGNWQTNDTCGDGISDYIKYLQGRNLRVRATNDPNNLIQLNVYTPLK